MSHTPFAPHRYEQQRQALASSTPQQEAEQQEQQEQQERQEEAPGVQSEPDPQEQQQERQVEAPQVQSEPDHPSRTLQQGQGDGQDSQEGIEEEQRAGDHAPGDSPVIAEVDVVD